MVSRPESSSNFIVSLASTLFVLALIFYMAFFNKELIEKTVYLMPILYFSIIAIYELLIKKSWRGFYTGIKDQPNKADVGRIAVKLWGLIATFIFLTFLYWLFPIYNELLYQNFFRIMKYAIPAVLILAPFYFAYVDRRMTHPKDGYYYMGCLFLLDFEQIDKSVILNHIRGWIIKGYFLPMMTNFMVYQINSIVYADYAKMHEFPRLIDLGFAIMYTIDLLPVVVGYACTLRVLDNHIVSAERHWFGWLVCVLCYNPFWGAVVHQYYFKWPDGPTWGYWLEGYSIIYYLWGTIMMFLLLLYGLASTAFGLRWSNLTYRGIVTDGPYRFTKHPAYVFKNMTWWMIYMPFMYHIGFENSIKQTIMMCGISMIYVFRAYTEERHLSKFPEYQQYGYYMNEHGIFRFMNKIIPWLKYTPEKYNLDSDFEKYKRS